MSTQARTEVDPAARVGIGFPLVCTLSLIGAFPGAPATGLDRFVVPTTMAKEQKGGAFIVTEAQVNIQTPGDRTTGSYIITLTKCSSAGAALGTIGTITVPANGSFTTVNLADAAGRGTRLKPGEGVRLDAGAVATGGTTSAANFTVRLFGESYGIKA